MNAIYATVTVTVGEHAYTAIYATVTVTVGEHTYTARLSPVVLSDGSEDIQVRITRDGVFAGVGYWWDDAIIDCYADLGDDVRDAIGAAIRAVVGA